MLVSLTVCLSAKPQQGTNVVELLYLHSCIACTNCIRKAHIWSLTQHRHLVWGMLLEFSNSSYTYAQKAFSAVVTSEGPSLT